MAWTPQFANEELARMRAQSEDRSSRATIRSKQRDDDFDTGRDSRTSDEDYYQKLLRDIERRLRTGQSANKREVDLLIERGLLELPEDYVLEGNRYVRMLMPEIRTKEQEEMGITPSMAPGGGVAFGSGFRGALTGDEAGILLSQRPTGPTAEQVSLVEGARGRIASRMREQDMAAAERASRELERMASLRGPKKTERLSKFDRKLQEQMEKDPMKWLSYQQSQERLTLEQEKFAEDKARKAKLEKRWDAISNFVIENEGKPEYEDVLAEVKDMRKSFVEAVNPEAAIAAIEASVSQGRRKAAQEKEDIAAANSEWDRRRGVLTKERIEAENRQVKRDSVRDENKNSATLKKEVDEISDEIASISAQINSLKELKKTVSEDRAIEVEEAIQSREIKLSGLNADLSSKQARLSQMSGFGGTEALPEGARGGGGQVVRVRLRDGREGSIPRSRLQEALADGAQVLE